MVQHGLEICNEFELRYGKEHATKKILVWLQYNKPNLPDNGFTPPPQCMPEEFRKSDVIEGYRNFYINDKIAVKGLGWKKIPDKKPLWIC